MPSESQLAANLKCWRRVLTCPCHPTIIWNHLRRFMWFVRCHHLARTFCGLKAQAPLAGRECVWPSSNSDNKAVSKRIPEPKTQPAHITRFSRNLCIYQHRFTAQIACVVRLTDILRSFLSELSVTFAPATCASRWDSRKPRFPWTKCPARWCRHPCLKVLQQPRQGRLRRSRLRNGTTFSSKRSSSFIALSRSRRESTSSTRIELPWSLQSQRGLRPRCRTWCCGQRSCHCLLVLGLRRHRLGCARL